MSDFELLRALAICFGAMAVINTPALVLNLEGNEYQNATDALWDATHGTHFFPASEHQPCTDPAMCTKALTGSVFTVRANTNAPLRAAGSKFEKHRALITARWVRGRSGFP